MRLLLEKVLETSDIARVRAALAGAAFVDGRDTSTLHGKNNLQLPLGSPAMALAEQTVVYALKAHATFELAARPHFISPPLFSKYEAGMEYPEHIDAAAMSGRRADLSITLFLSDPATYAGGALVIDTGNGERSYRLAAGDAIAYPSATLHRVAAVTHGERLAAVLWVQSDVRDPRKRHILHDLASVLRDMDEHAYSSRLRRSYRNLVHLWSDVQAD